jgi:hypothetical protein
MVGAGCVGPDGGSHCAQVQPITAAITTMGVVSPQSGGLSYGPAAQSWGSYTYAAPGQTAPTGAVTADGNGIQIAGGFVPPIDSSNDYAGFGLFFNASTCLDTRQYTGVQFDFAGDLGGCQLGFGASFSGDLSVGGDMRGGCTAASCYGPSVDVTALALDTTRNGPTLKVPFTALNGGMPIATLDPSTLVTIQWQLSSPLDAADGGGCSASFTVENVSFY